MHARPLSVDNGDGLDVDDALMARLELARAMQAAAALRPLCDSLDAHPLATLRALAALVHTPNALLTYDELFGTGADMDDRRPTSEALGRWGYDR